MEHTQLSNEQVSIHNQLLQASPEKRGEALEAWQKLKAYALNAQAARATQITAEQLLAKGDEQAVRRLVYGLKTGDIFSAQVLSAYAPLSALTYMVEDIDHGIQTNMIGADDLGDVNFPSVKHFATQIALKSLASSKILPKQTLRFFNHLSESNYQRPGYFNDEFAQIIVDWWSHNKDSLMARRYGDATWLPNENVSRLESWWKGNRVVIEKRNYAEAA